MCDPYDTDTDTDPDPADDQALDAFERTFPTVDPEVQDTEAVLDRWEAHQARQAAGELE